MFQRTQTVKVRPLSYADIERLAQGDTVHGFRVEDDGLRPCEIRPRPLRGGGYAKPIPAAVLDESPRNVGGYIAERDGQPVGFKVDCATNFEGGITSGATFYTTPEAEESVDLRLNQSKDASASREMFAVEEPTGAEMTTVPLYGAQASLTIFVKDITDEEILQRVNDAIENEFAGEVFRIHGAKSRVVLDRRVDVISFGRPRDIVEAANVLDAEASYYASSPGGFQTRPAQIQTGGE